MSTFSGFFEEIPWISADRFMDDNINVSKLLFLSHCHFDHMIGLSEVNSSMPYKEHGPIYTSPISSVFLKKQFSNLKNFHSLEIECPTELSYMVEDKKFTLVVTTLSAQHCPGSVMFLFETDKVSILYTGDFRLTLSAAEKNHLLKNRSFDSIYLDSTFLDKRYQHFPTQFESVKAICKLINEWLETDQSLKIILELPAQYGSEFLFMEIERKLKQKIYVHPQQFDKYIYFPQMDKCISNDRNECRIITRFKNELKNVDKQFRTIIPSAMYWSNWSPDKNMIKKENNEIYRVAYSNHCSCTELKDFLNFIKPKKVKLNVIPDGSKYKMTTTLEEIYNYEKLNETPKIRKDTKSPDSISFSNIFFREPRKRISINMELESAHKHTKFSTEK